MNKKKKNIWIFAGESSGDMYGARLAESLKTQYKEGVSISGMGASAMKKAGVNILVDSTELGVVGLIEVLKHIFTFIGIFTRLVKQAKKERPDAVVLIDYPGFNIRFAKQMHKAGIPVVWYISPHVWAWGKKRIPKLAVYCKKMLVIFPFEIDVYKDTSLDIEFVGHPLVDIIKEQQNPNIIRDNNKLLLLPGSRSHEIERLLPPMLDTAVKLKKEYPELKFLISAERPKIEQKINEIITSYTNENSNSFSILNKDLEIRKQNAKLLQQEAATAIATSGTVTVECALNKLPIVSLYIVNPLTYFIGWLLTKVTDFTLFRGFFTMPNIIANKMVYKELLQKNVTSENVLNATKEILPGGTKRTETESNLHELVSELTCGKSNASYNAAVSIKKMLEGK
jgi:lipid-A-disaccharide synthase